MSGGTFSVSRQIWQHPAFKREAFTEREAWIWMFGRASWKRRVDRVGEIVVSLERGQLAVSTRFAAKAWGWTDSKVRRFFTRLQKLEMVSLKTDAGVTVVTIRNYDEYQLGGAVSDAHPTQTRRRGDAKKKKDKIQKEDGGKDDFWSVDEASVPAPANEVSAAVARWNDVAADAGWSEVQKLNPNRSKQLRARLVECGGMNGWEVALRKACASDFCRGRTPKPWFGFSFDWLIKAANFTKLMEGNYDNRIGSTEELSERQQDRIDPAIEQIARLSGIGATPGHSGS